jgi:CRP-like cAMP-binding protein
VIGEYGLVTPDARRTATLVAQGPAWILTLDYPRFRQFVLAYPQCVLAMFGVTVDRLQRKTARGLAGVSRAKKTGRHVPAARVIGKPARTRARAKRRAA